MSRSADRLGARILVPAGIVLAVMFVSGCLTTTSNDRDWRKNLKSEKCLVRLRAVAIASKAPAEEAIPLLIDRLEDTDDAIRSMAYEALLRRTDQVIAFDPLDDPFERRAAVENWRKWWRTQTEEELAEQATTDEH